MEAYFVNVSDQNDIDEDTRMQIELINQAFAELQVKNKGQIRKDCPRIEFIRPEEEYTTLVIGDIYRFTF